jgi:light-regulated signal transduction histidine kinase (bacteriophytochrome)
MEQAIHTGHNLASKQAETEEKCSEEEMLKTKLAEMTKEMNQFTYIVSHDLQAPLRMVTGFLELLEKKHSDKLNESAKQYIDYAVKGANKMKSLIFDLLEYSRLSSVVKEPAEVDLNVILQEVKEKLAPVIEEAGAIVTNDNLPVVIADSKKMIQLFEHLLGNALKFRSKAVPEISIAVKEENGFWVIAVNDNGIGIDPAFAEKIFIVFRRLFSDETRYGGTGIGLAICKKIAELHGGTIWVESAADKGSTFFFTLPVKTL